MTTRRQGRFRGDPDPKPAKPIPPLRYRVLPVERDFDNLDMLQAELDRERPRMPEDDYQTLQDVIDKRRQTLTSRRASLTGESVGTDYDAMPYSEDAVKSFSFRLTPAMAGWALVAFVAIGLAING